MSVPVALLIQALEVITQSPEAAAPSRAPTSQRADPAKAAATADNFADVMQAVLKCYHVSAHYQLADVVKTPWERQSQYGAQKSAVIRIKYSGLSRTPYRLDVAVMQRGNEVRSHLLSDNAVIPAKKSCALERWTAAEPPKAR